ERLPNHAPRKNNVTADVERYAYRLCESQYRNPKWQRPGHGAEENLRRGPPRIRFRWQMGSALSPKCPAPSQGRRCAACLETGSPDAASLGLAADLEKA